MGTMQKTMDKLRKTSDREHLRTAADFFVGFLLATVRVGNMRPFGIAFGLSRAKGEAARCAGAFLGSLLALKNGGVLYAAMIMICFSCDLVFRETAVYKNKLFMPVCIGLSVVCVKGASVFVQASARSVVLLVCEAALASMLSVSFGIYKSGKKDIGGFLGGSVLGFAVLMAASPHIFENGLGAAGIFAAAATLCAAGLFNSAAAAGVGILLGAFFDIAAFSYPRLAFIFGLGGLLAGIGKDTSAMLRAVMFVAGSLCAIFWYGGQAGAVGLAVQCLLGAAAAWLYLKRSRGALYKGACALSAQKNKNPRPDVPMSRAIECLGDLAQDNTVIRKGEGINKALEWAFDSVCSSCSMAKDCWSKNYPSTRRALDEIGDVLRDKKAVFEQDLPAVFAHNCRKKGELCTQISRQYASLSAFENAKKKQQQNSELMKKQYDSVAMLLREAGGEDISRNEFLFALSKKAENVAKGYFGVSKCRAYYKNGHTVIDILLPEKWNTADLHAVKDSLSLASGCRLSDGELKEDSEGKKLRFCIESRIRTRVEWASVSKENEKICGDCCRHTVTSDKKQIVILSDGMGTGEAAKRLSDRAAEAVLSLAAAGVPLTAAAKALDSVLETGVETKGFATLDMVEIDMVSAQCVFVKYGAAPSYIVRCGKVQKVWKQSLPAALGGEGAVMYCTLQPGDRIVMMTDGANVPASFEGSAEQICSRMTDGKAGDDMTGAVIDVLEG